MTPTRRVTAIAASVLAISLGIPGATALAKAKSDKAKAEPAAQQKQAATAAEKQTEKTAAKKPEKKPEKKKVVRFTIKGDYPEGPSQPGLFGELQPSLQK